MPEPGNRLFAGQVALAQVSKQPRVIDDSIAVEVDHSERGFDLAESSQATAMAGARRDYNLLLADLTALEPAINVKKPLLIRTHRASDISTISHLAKA